MPTLLDANRRRLTSRISTLDLVFERHAIEGVRKRLDRSALQEGLVSALWQSWCAFCRDTVLSSALGATTSQGVSVTSPYVGRSEMEVCYVARELAAKRRIATVKTLGGSYLEPTWGDLTKLNLILSGIACSNQNQLLTAFGAALALQDLQLCRNASAHLNKDNISVITAARVKYQHTKFIHPSDVVFWVDPQTKDYLWKTWIEEITIVSELAVC
jgi:hypothetical protein